MKNSKSLRRFVNNIYCFSFFNALMVLMPVYAIFMQEHGISDVQLSTLFMLWCVGAMIFQIPAAWLNRFMGGKKAILLGQLAKVASFILWFAAPNYWGFAAGMVLWGLQGAIYNVSYESLLYDELKAQHNCELYCKVLGRRKALSTIGSALSAGGSLLLFLGYDFILAATVASMLISTVFIARIDVKANAKKSRRKQGKQVSFVKIMKMGVKAVTRTSCTLYLLLIAVMLSNFSYIDDYFSVIGLEIGLDKKLVGLVSLFIMCCSMIGGTNAYRMKKIGDRVLYLLISVAGLFFIAFSWVYSVAGLLLLGLAYVLSSGLNVLNYTKFQDAVPTSHRPIALSLYSMMNNTLYIVVLALFGLGSTLGGWKYSVLIMGGLCVLLGIWALFFVGDKCSAGYPVKSKGRKLSAAKTTSVSPSQF